MLRFLHTADWQIGKPYERVADPSKREALRRQRIKTVRNLASIIKEHHCSFVVVCGDTFDSFTPEKSTVAACCSAIGSLEVPVFLIAGNHDSNAPGCIWDQRFFKREMEQLAPNLILLRVPEPHITDEAVFLPCPLSGRHITEDPTQWLRHSPTALPKELPSIILAHGSVQNFSSREDEDHEGAIQSLHLDLLPPGIADYVALGDWHGKKEIDDRTWYSGTPEQDRFARGANHPGHVLVVEIEAPGTLPKVTPIPTGCIQWHQKEFHFNDDAALELFIEDVDRLIGSRIDQDLLKLDLSGSLSFEGSNRLHDFEESLNARLIDCRINSSVRALPSTEELNQLLHLPDPLISTVAAHLSAISQPGSSSEESDLALLALRELYYQANV